MSCVIKSKSGVIKSKYPCWCAITQHALEQFIRRWSPNASIEDAADELFALLATSKKTDNSIMGDSIYVSGHRPEIRMVVKDRNVCVTVLPISNSNKKYQDECEEMEYSFQESVNSLYFQLSKLEIERQKIIEEKQSLDEQKRLLGDKYSQIHNQMQVVKAQLKKMGVE